MACVPAAASTFQNHALHDACVLDLLTLIENSDSKSGGSGHTGSDPDRPDRIVLSTADLLGAVSAAFPVSVAL